MNGYLVLETGLVFPGKMIGAKQSTVGEVVFNTSHSGYEQIASDPSYFQQIIVMTAPQQGNYGVRASDWESRRYWIEGFVCLEMQSSPASHEFLADLTQFGIPVLTEVNTRELVLYLRQQGTVRGGIISAESEQAALKIWQEQKNKKIESEDWPYLVSRKEKEVRAGLKPDGPKVAVIDFGCKENILRSLMQRCREVEIYNSRTSAKEILSGKPDGVLLPNGPGDPEKVEVAVGTVQELLGQKPIFGICMGHQILARALGGKTYKLRFGHRGANHPVKDKILNRIYVTSQNHGYSVDPESLPPDVEVTHINLNDKTAQGLRAERLQCFSVQFHPESHPGPNDGSGLFDVFMNMMR